MYYQNLMIIKEEVSNSNEIGTKILSNLDNWLASLSFQKLERINPYQFALDWNYNERDVLKIFLAGASKDIFKIFYEVRNDEDEYIGLIDEEQYRNVLINKESIELYSRYTGEKEEFFAHNIEVWFSINMKPVTIPNITNNLKKETASPVMGDDSNYDLFSEFMGR